MFIVEIIGHLFFWVVMFAGIIIIPVGLPGTFLIIGNALIFGWITDFTEVTWGFLVILLLVAFVAEAIEFFVGAAAAAKFGGSKSAMIGAVVGGFVGAILMSPLIPVLGTILGAFVGAFAGAAVMEFFSTNDIEKSIRVGYGAFLGALGGKLTKIAAGIAMVVMVGLRVYL